MSAEIPELVMKSAEKILQEFSSVPITRSGRHYLISPITIKNGFELVVSLAEHEQSLSLARLTFSPELGQWTLHRPRSDERWSYVAEAGGSLDLNRLLRYLKDDPLNIFWS